jgi:hypothetical protein
MVNMTSLNASLTNIVESFQKKFPLWDIVMVFDVFLFFLSFCILTFEKDGDKVFGAREWLWYFNALFILDLFFRLLSFHIESVKREYWNSILPCMFTLILYMLAGYYDFDNVFGSKPTQGFNIFLFIVYHFGLIGWCVFHCQNKTHEPSSLSQIQV